LVLYFLCVVYPFTVRVTGIIIRLSLGHTKITHNLSVLRRQTITRTIALHVQLVKKRKDKYIQEP